MCHKYKSLIYGYVAIAFKLSPNSIEILIISCVGELKNLQVSYVIPIIGGRSRGAKGPGPLKFPDSRSTQEFKF